MAHKKKNLATQDAPKSPAKRRLSMSHVLAVSPKLNRGKNPSKKGHGGKRHRAK